MDNLLLVIIRYVSFYHYIWSCYG